MSSVWENRELDLILAIREKDYNAVEKYVSDNQQQILRKWNNKDNEELKTTLHLGSTILKYFTNRISSDEIARSYFLIGKLMGTIECMNHCLHEKISENLIKKDVAIYCATIRHFNDVVKAVGDAGIISHSELGKTLSMRESTLSEAMKSILCTEYVIASKVGRFKLYSLSDYGVKHYNVLLDKNKGEIEKANLFENIKNQLDNSYNYYENGKRRNDIINIAGYAYSTADDDLELAHSNAKVWPNCFNNQLQMTDIRMNKSNNMYSFARLGGKRYA